MRDFRGGGVENFFLGGGVEKLSGGEKFRVGVEKFLGG